MELLAAYDPYMIFSLFVSFLLTLCLVVMFLMRAPYAVPPHPVRQTLWCAGRRHSARVDFVEWVETGMVHRSVERCSLRAPEGRCDAACCDQPV